MKPSYLIIIIVGIVLFLFLYIVMLRLSYGGWGYMGYYGYHRGPSWWYWGHPPIYYERPSFRTGSLGGPEVGGGGPRYGK